MFFVIEIDLFFFEVEILKKINMISCGFQQKLYWL